MALSHLVVLPLPIYGHIFPMLRLSVQLAAIASRVTFISSKRTEKAILSALGFSLSQIEDAHLVSSRLGFEFLSDDGDLGQGSSNGFIANFVWMHKQAVSISRILDSSQPVSCVIVDSLVSFLGDVAKERDIPVAMFWPSSAPWLLLSMQLKTLVDGGFVPLTPSNANSVISELEGIPPLCNYKDVPVCVLKPETETQIKVIEMSGRQMQEARWLLTNTFPGLDSDSLDCIRRLGAKLVTVGPLLPRPTSRDHLSPDDFPVLRFLDEKPRSSVLYICFGTLAEMSQDQLHELGGALEELEDQNFLWVLREPQQAFLSDGFKRRTSARGMVVPWCSQFQVLSHPSTGGFLTHCGWNSILESFTCGVAMIGWPFLAEQSLNAKYLVDVWKAGIRIVPYNSDGGDKVVNRSEISQAIATLMATDQGKVMKQRASEIQIACQRAKETSMANLKSWIEENFY